MRMTGVLRLRRVTVGALLAGLAVGSCGGEPSLMERMAGTFATEAVQADLEEHEKEFISADLHGRFDSFDKDEAAESGATWARLRLHGNGRFEYEGPATGGGEPDARLGGRWSARPGFVDLTVEQATGSGAEGLEKGLACPATTRWVEMPFLVDSVSRDAVRLVRR
jgi:hypothetical protein